MAQWQLFLVIWFVVNIFGTKTNAHKKVIIKMPSERTEGEKRYIRYMAVMNLIALILAWFIAGWLLPYLPEI